MGNYMTKTSPNISKNEIDLRNSLTSMQILKEEVEKENLQLKEELTSSSIEGAHNISALRSTIVMLESELQDLKNGELKSLELEEEKVKSQPEPEVPIVESQPEPEVPIVESQPEPETPIVESKPEPESPVVESQVEQEKPVLESQYENEEEDICEDLKEARKLAELALKNNKEQLDKLKENESEIIIKRQSALFEQDEKE
jgi:hypothetical protein